MGRLKEYNRFRFIWALLFLWVAVVGTGCAGTAKEPEIPESTPLYATDARPLTPQPDANALTPGLAVRYFRGFSMKTLDHIPSGEFAEEIGRQGKPIPYINHSFGRGVVFDSGRKTNISLRMTGLINFQQTGQYVLQAMLNDGVRVYIDGQRVINASRWKKEGDRLSNLGYVTINTAGWYPMELEYYQKLGTATLKLFWQTPDSKEMVPIPAEAYAHMEPAS